MHTCILYNTCTHQLTYAYLWTIYTLMLIQACALIYLYSHMKNNIYLKLQGTHTHIHIDCSTYPHRHICEHSYYHTLTFTQSHIHVHIHIYPLTYACNGTFRHVFIHLLFFIKTYSQILWNSLHKTAHVTYQTNA